ncbi:DUF4123 domain-containing protein [Leisingera sp. S132]|uniref:DUF4123 domain-containing protein n=1 Tax=Leisingera sp. S132 TaxID=2867016 RepID=UPI0021A545E6|nr:DUF4123 domain-containing protein [Leisingera sp. S132]UWQ79509.1 DUF4123 domain-containing protein [Leisingera sp. S132]
MDGDWGQPAGAPDNQPVLQLEFGTLAEVEPLGTQFGADQPKTVPDILHPAIFGQPGLGDEPEGKRRLNTYALLDAAKVPALLELLETSGLEHRCLFKGTAYDELKEAAPWIVRLEEGNSFTRSLFTHSDAPWHLWDAEPGLYLRSRGTLEQMWQQLRKFTRVRDENGKWFYFRFWEADCLINYLGFAETHGQSDFRPLFGFDPMEPSAPLVHSYISRHRDKARVCSVVNMTGHNAEIRADIDMPVLRFLALRSHAFNFAESYFAGQSLGPQALQQAKDFSAAIVQKYYRHGFKSRYHLGSFAYWALALNGDFETRTPSMQNHIQRSDINPNDRFVLMAREMKHVFGSKIRNYRGHGS